MMLSRCRGPALWCQMPGSFVLWAPMQTGPLIGTWYLSKFLAKKIIVPNFFFFCTVHLETLAISPEYAFPLFPRQCPLSQATCPQSSLTAPPSHRVTWLSAYMAAVTGFFSQLWTRFSCHVFHRVLLTFTYF